METIKDKEFGGERPLFAARDLRLEHVTIHAGESALKCTRNIEAVGCRFGSANILSGTPMVSAWKTVCLRPERVRRCGIRAAV